MSGAQIVAEQESATRPPTSRIDSESWDGVAQVGRIEKDVARHLDPRVLIRVLLRLETELHGPGRVSIA